MHRSIWNKNDQRVQLKSLMQYAMKPDIVFNIGNDLLITATGLLQSR